MKVPCALAPQSLALSAPTKPRGATRASESARDFRHGLLGPSFVHLAILSRQRGQPPTRKASAARHGERRPPAAPASTTLATAS